VKGGTEVVSTGGTTRGTIVRSGGLESVRGVASGGTVSSGGRLIVSAGGVASGGRVNSGGTETVYGRASGGTINGGLIEVANGGTASGTLTFLSGGTLQLDAGAHFTGHIKGFGTPDLLDRIDLRGVAFGAGTTRSFTEAASTTSGTLTVTDGTHTVHLTLLGLYKTSNFKLSTDNHGGTRVTDPPLAAGASPMTFDDLAPARLHSAAPASGSPSGDLLRAIAVRDEAYAGRTLLATGSPGGPGDGNHHLMLPAPR
jgi:autotransporter passenger strand-loop-strand repeat protein